MRSRRRTVLFCGLAFLASSLAQAAPRDRDVWHSYIADDKRYGYVHTVVVRLPDGNFRITRQTRLLVDVLGINKEEISERDEYVVTADYRPVSIAVEGRRDSGVAMVTGRSRGPAFEVTATVAGIARSRVFDRPEMILLEPCLEDWLADRPPDFETGELTLLGEESCTLKPAKVKRIGARAGGPGVTWSVATTDLAGDQRLVLDADGRCLARSASGGLTDIRIAPADQARDIAFRKMDGRDVLMYPLGREIGPPELLDSLTIELKWKGIPFDRFRLEDDRQIVVEKSHEGDQYRAVVRIEPPKPLPAPAKVPISGPKFEPYLGESRYIRPHDEKVVAVAREVMRGQGRRAGGRQGPERLDVEQHRAEPDRRDPDGTGGAGLPEGEVQRVCDVVRLPGASGRHPHSDRARRADDRRPVGRPHVERGLCRALDTRRLFSQRSRDVLCPGQADRS